VQLAGSFARINITEASIGVAGKPADAWNVIVPVVPKCADELADSAAGGCGSPLH